MKNYWWFVLLTVLLIVGWWMSSKNKQIIISPEAPYFTVEKPLEKYSFESLRGKVFLGSEIEIKEDIFYYAVDPPVGGQVRQGAGQDKLKMSGQIKIPEGNPPLGGWPVVIMIRGYADQEIYETGMGTRNAAAFFSKNGFLTLAPDFLGYGESDLPPDNSLEERFMRPGQVLELIASVKNIKDADENKINIWGHSNGGQIALSVLEISSKDYPTSLWAPVSKPFPYSILYYTDEFDDLGRALRKVVAGFEAMYEADDYSIDSYYDWIEAPIQIHQGTNDDAVPVEWSRKLVEKLEELEKKVELYVYTGADHNLAGPLVGERKAWNAAVRRDLEWFRSK